MRKFIDKFLRKAKIGIFKLMRMVGKDNEIDKEWETFSDKLLELYEKAPEHIGNKLKILKKKANIRELEKEPEKIKKRNIYWYIIGVPIVFFLSSFILREEFEQFNQIFYSRWIPQIFPILLFFILGCIPYILGKTTDWGIKVYLICVCITILYISISLKADDFSITLSKGSPFVNLMIESLILGTLSFIMAFLFIGEVIKPNRIIKINKDDFIYLKSNSDIESIIEIMMNSLYYNIEGIRKIIPLKEEEGIAICDIGKDMRFFLSYISNKLSFITLRQKGRYITQDELCKKTQKEIVYVLKNILDFSNYQGKTTNDLYLNQGNVFEKYIELPRLRSILKKHSTKILVGIIAILVTFGYFKKEELLKASLPYLFTIFAIIVTIFNLYLLLFKLKSSR